MTKYNKYTKCYLCSSSKLRDLFAKENFTICKCLNCELVFVRDILNEDELNVFYSIDRDEGIKDPVYDDDFNTKNLLFYYKKMQHLIEKIVHKGRLLDIGCNSGQFLELMSKSSWEAFGIERSPKPFRKAKKIFGDNIFFGILKNYREKQKFDVITIMDVLDHCIDPVNDLKIAYRKLRKEGVLSVKVHNIDCLLAKVTGKDFYAFLPPYHLFYFSPKTLTIAMNKAGFEVASVAFIGHWLTLKIIFYRLAKHNKQSIFFFLFKLFSVPLLNRISVYKQFYDIQTIIAVKK